MYIMSVCTRSGIIWKGRKHVHVHGSNRICFAFKYELCYCAHELKYFRYIFATILYHRMYTRVPNVFRFFFFFCTQTHTRTYVCVCVHTHTYSYAYTYIYRDHIHNSPRKSEGGKGKDNLIRSLATGSAAA